MIVNDVPERDRGVIAIDLGKTSCRIRVGDALLEGHGSPGLAERDGVERAASAISALVEALPTRRVDVPVTMSVGAAGAAFAPEQARVLAQLLAARFGVDAAVTSDVVTAHAGALSGRPGVVLVAGTGAVATAVAADGAFHRADGAGVWLGDEGSGRWIGSHGLRAVVRAHDGRGPATTLTQAAVAGISPVDALPSTIGSSDAPERALAEFAPAVLAAAADGDAVANSIVETAIGHLVETTAAVSAAGARVVVLGGLARSPTFAARLHQALEAADMAPSPADGDALDGAELIARRLDLPHERQVARVKCTASI